MSAASMRSSNTSAWSTCAIIVSSTIFFSWEKSMTMPSVPAVSAAPVLSVTSKR